MKALRLGSLDRFVALFCVLVCASILARAQDTALSWSPQQLENGSPCLFTVNAPNAHSVTGLWQGKSLHFIARPGSDSWYVIAGIDVGTKPGPYPIAISIEESNAVARKLVTTIQVAEAAYRTTTLSVPDKYVAPDAAALKIIAHDKTYKDAAFAKTSSTPLWSGSFKPPIRTPASTDSFGTRRVFNGSLASIHRGLDYRAKTGTPVAAVNSGRVVLARKLYYEGNCVIVDHGQGFMTLYMHLSQFRVKEGETVKKGQLLALSGGTGRATGPHLHLGVRWQGDYLDAAKLFALHLP